MRLAIGLIVSGEVITRIYESPSVAGPGTSPYAGAISWDFFAARTIR
jgi:hypothetical protein